MWLEYALLPTNSVSFRWTKYGSRIAVGIKIFERAVSEAQPQFIVANQSKTQDTFKVFDLAGTNNVIETTNPLPATLNSIYFFDVYSIKTDRDNIPQVWE